MNSIFLNIIHLDNRGFFLNYYLLSSNVFDETSNAKFIIFFLYITCFLIFFWMLIGFIHFIRKFSGIYSKTCLVLFIVHEIQRDHWLCKVTCFFSNGWSSCSSSLVTTFPSVPFLHSGFLLFMLVILVLVLLISSLIISHWLSAWLCFSVLWEVHPTPSFKPEVHSGLSKGDSFLIHLLKA